jgi:hypothetical protein
MTSSRVHHDHVHVCARKDLPARWAAELGRALAPDLPPLTVDLAQERVVALGDGIQLAHLRTSLVEECTLAAFKATDVDSDADADWLWLVVLMPEGDVARHLGWLAHLAAVLHDQDNLRRLKLAASGEKVAETLEAVLSVEPQRHVRPASPSPAKGGAAVTHRRVVAVLKGDETVDQLLTLFVEHDVQGATIVDGVGMGEHLAAHLSLFAGFRMAFKSVGKSHVVLAVIPVERTDEVLELARLTITGAGTGTGIAWAMDVVGLVNPLAGG